MSSCFFPNMAVVCQVLVQSCAYSVAAHTACGPNVQLPHTVVPSAPWNVIRVDTLELGASKNHQYHCVLVL